MLRDRKVPIKLKSRLYNIIMVGPAMLKRSGKKDGGAGMRNLRFSLARLENIRNVIIRESIGVGELGEKLQKTRLRWMGHVLRREILCEPDS